VSEKRRREGVKWNYGLGIRKCPEISLRGTIKKSSRVRGASIPEGYEYE
jgi:hypothetical protein